MRYLYINLLVFTSSALGGSAYYAKRLLSALYSKKIYMLYKVLVFVPENDEVMSFFELKRYNEFEVKVCSGFNSPITRILYEQFVLPVFLSNNGVYFNPNPSMPFFLRRKEVKYIVTIHDLIPFFVKNKYSPLRSLYVKLLTIVSAKFSDKIVAVSKSTKKDLYELLKVKEDKVKVIYNFIDMKQVADVSYEKYFLTVCTVEPGKNIRRLIDAFSEFISCVSEEDFKLIIVGKLGYKSKELLDYVEEKGLMQKVIFTGYISENEKNAYYKKCLGVVYVSYYEGFGIPPLEALYFNKSSVCSNVSSLPEVIGDTGYLVDPYSVNEILLAMMDMYIDPKKFIPKIKSQLSRFDPGVVADKFIREVVN